VKKDLEINSEEIDILKELGNIGLGNATISLSEMLKDEKIKMLVPDVSLISLAEVPDLVGGPEKPVAAVFSRAIGEASFFLIFLMPEKSALNIIKALTEGIREEFCSLGRSVIREVGNIVSASYLNALSFLTDSAYRQTPPILAIDMAGAILGTIFAEASIIEDSILMVKTSFSTEVNDIEGCLIIVPHGEGLKKIVDILGLELKK